jgi:MFS family permease
MTIQIGGGSGGAGIVLTVLGVGILVFDVPGGMIIARFGFKLAMLFGVSLSGLSTFGMGFSDSVSSKFFSICYPMPSSSLLKGNRSHFHLNP